MLSFYLSTIATPTDQEKCIKLYNKYKQIMLKVAYSILKDYYLSNDAVHESFLKIIKNLDCIDNVDSTRTRNYLITIVKNDSLKIYNKRKQLQEDSYDMLSYEVEGKEDLELEYLTDYSVEYIKNKIKYLSDIHCDILLLKLFNNLSYEQIAQSLGISQVAARKRYERAKQALIELLRKDDVYDF